MKYFSYAIVFCLVACSPQNKKEIRPNILLIVADDLGYTDLGVFGGDIKTPNLDSLAKQGVVFSRFHTSPYCAVTRAMLLSGTDNHIAGMGSQDLVTDVFGYEGHLSDRVIPIPQLLKESGYHTMMTGKWHLGKTPDQDPTKKGFENAFALLEGAGNHYNHVGVFPEEPISPYTENGVSTSWPEGAYSTDFYTDKLISYIDSYKEDDSPFFAFAAYTSPHWPLQVDPKFSEKYEGMYDDGYEALRLRRFEKQKKLGFIPENAQLPKVNPSVTPWDSLSKEDQKWQSRAMEIYAGMVDNLDYNIGKLISYLRKTDQLANTLVIFFSDNGAAAEDFYNHEYFGDFLRQHYTTHYDTMGTAKSFVSYGPQWAEAGTSVFKYYKSYTTQGGINTPFIISGPGLKINEVTHAFASIKDIAPTLYEFVGARYPESNQSIYPLEGKSMKSLLEGKSEAIHERDYSFILEHRGHVLVRKGDWKLVNMKLPFNEVNFELFDLSKDLGEQTDVKGDYPEKYAELLSEWEVYQEHVKVQIPTPQPGEALNDNQ